METSRSDHSWQEESNSPPEVSVIVPLYNGGEYIESALQSILSQSFASYEILVVDDGSTDGGPAKVSVLAKEFPQRMRLLHHPDRGNHGIAASRNLGIRSARGMYVAFVDQDDLWLPHKLERQVKTLERFPQAAFVYARSAFVDQYGAAKILNGIHKTEGKGIAEEPRNIFSELLKENFVPTLTVLARKSCLERVDLFDEGPRYEYEDWLLLSKLAFFYDVIFIPQTLSMYRVHKDNYSAYVLGAGLAHEAEEHYTAALFSFLMRQHDVQHNRVHDLFRRRIWFFFLRARSWGASREVIAKHELNLIRQFPDEKRTIQAVARMMLILPPGLAAALRRIRRNVIGI